MTSKLNAPVFVVGLERLKAERYQRVLNDLAQIGVAATVWPAVDGAQPIKYEPGESVRRFQFFMYARRGKALLKTEIGCYLSHWRLWKHAFVEKDCERIVVLEDDAAFDATHFKEALANIAKLNQAFEYIHLARRWRAKGEGMALTSDGKYALYEGVYPEMGGMFGYAISRQGFKKLATALMPIYKTVDLAITGCSERVNLRVWAVFPWLCRFDSSVASSMNLGRGWNSWTWRHRRLVKFALSPARWIYQARMMMTGWTNSRQDAAPARRAYARAYAQWLLAFAWQDIKSLRRRPFKRTSALIALLVYRFLRGGVGAIRIETRRREAILGA